MRFFLRVLKIAASIAVFLVLLGFVAKNMDTVAVRYFLGLEWHAPLMFVLLICLGVGVGLGAVSSVAVIARQKREILTLKRELRRRGRALTAPAAGSA